LKIGGSENVAVMVEEANALLEQGKLNEAAAIYRDIVQNQQLKAEAVGIAGLGTNIRPSLSLLSPLSLFICI
jgi:hypothetical protein